MDHHTHTIIIVYELNDATYRDGHFFKLNLKKTWETFIVTFIYLQISFLVAVGKDECFCAQRTSFNPRSVIAPSLGASQHTYRASGNKFSAKFAQRIHVVVVVYEFIIASHRVALAYNGNVWWWWWACRKDDDGVVDVCAEMVRRATTQSGNRI